MQIHKWSFAVVTLLVIVPITLVYGEAVPVSLWNGEGNPEDSIGPNDGVEVGTVNYAPGEVGMAFDLESGYVEVPNPHDGGLASTTGFTVAAWIREDAFVHATPVANLRTSGNASGFSLESRHGFPGQFELLVNVTGLPYDYLSLYSDGWPVGETHHIAATFDSANHTMTIYRDGKRVACRNDFDALPMVVTGSELFQIGRNIVIGTQWNGLIDELHYFDRALTDEEIRVLVGAAPPCEGDANGDGIVDPLDTGYVLARFGCDVESCNPDCVAADQNLDGIVDPLDAGYVLSRFGDCS